MVCTAHLQKPHHRGFLTWSKESCQQPKRRVQTLDVFPTLIWPNSIQKSSRSIKTQNQVPWPSQPHRDPVNWYGKKRYIELDTRPLGSLVPLICLPHCCCVCMPVSLVLQEQLPFQSLSKNQPIKLACRTENNPFPCFPFWVHPKAAGPAQVGECSVVGCLASCPLGLGSQLLVSCPASLAESAMAAIWRSGLAFKALSGLCRLLLNRRVLGLHVLVLEQTHKSGEKKTGNLGTALPSIHNPPPFLFYVQLKDDMLNASINAYSQCVCARALGFSDYISSQKKLLYCHPGFNLPFLQNHWVVPVATAEGPSSISLPRTCYRICFSDMCLHSVAKIN